MTSAKLVAGFGHPDFSHFPRRAHRLADTDALWLGDRSKAFCYDALHQTLGMRAQKTGITDFRPHRLRHTARRPWWRMRRHGGTPAGQRLSRCGIMNAWSCDQV